MPTKVFTLIGGKCPFGKGCDIDTESCRKCEWFYRAGTGTFFWCRHPIEQKPSKIEQKAPEIAKKLKVHPCTLYRYLGDRITRTELKGAICVSVLRENGKCIRGRNANMLVSFPGIGKVVVCGRLLRKIK